MKKKELFKSLGLEDSSNSSSNLIPAAEVYSAEPGRDKPTSAELRREESKPAKHSARGDEALPKKSTTDRDASAKKVKDASNEKPKILAGKNYLVSDGLGSGKEQAIERMLGFSPDEPSRSRSKSSSSRRRIRSGQNQKSPPDEKVSATSRSRKLEPDQVSQSHETLFVVTDPEAK